MLGWLRHCRFAGTTNQSPRRLPAQGALNLAGIGGAIWRAPVTLLSCGHQAYYWGVLAVSVAGALANGSANRAKVAFDGERE
jgi:hypothetical protein